MVTILDTACNLPLVADEDRLEARRGVAAFADCRPAREGEDASNGAERHEGARRMHRPSDRREAGIPATPAGSENNDPSASGKEGDISHQHDKN
jgi:hypothetical protein